MAVDASRLTVLSMTVYPFLPDVLESETLYMEISL